MQTWLKLHEAGMLGPATHHSDREVLFERGEVADAAWFLVDGAVEVLQPSEGDGGVLLKLLHGPTLFGAIEQLVRESTYLETVRVLGHAQVVRLPRSAFLHLLRTHNDAVCEGLLDLSTGFCVAARLEGARRFEVEALLANVLLAYIDVAGEPWDGGGECQRCCRMKVHAAARFSAMQCGSAGFK
jgi:CRP-like cAMP-binding protein